MDSIRSQLIALRTGKKLSVKRLASLTGLNRQAIAFIEKGERIPSIHTLARLALGLGIMPSELFRNAEQIAKLRIAASAGQEKKH